VVGAPVDPAIISSQLKGPARKSPVARTDENKALGSSSKSTTPKPDAASKLPDAAKKPSGPTSEVDNDKSTGNKASDGKAVDGKASQSKTSEKPGVAPLRSSAAGRATAQDGAPSATATVERDVLTSFKSFAAVQRSNAEKVRIGKAKADKEVKLTELKKFADTFKLSTPVPTDLIGIIAKDPLKQKEIQAKAIQNAEDVLKAKEAATKTKESPTKDAPSKSQAETPTSATAPASSAADTKPTTARSQGSHGGTSSHTTVQGRHGQTRQSYGSGGNYNSQTFRPDRSGGHAQQARATGQLGQRLREQHKPSQVAHGPMATENRPPPTGPANNVDPSYNRRLSGAPSHFNKLNPNTQEFRPSPFAAAFSPGGHPSAGSSPRSTVNHTDSSSQNMAAPALQAVRRKVKAVDKTKCSSMAHIETIKAPQGKNWEDNGGLRPTYDTQPTWRQLQEEIEKADSTMQLTYKQYLERNPFSGPPGSLSTPNPPHVTPHMAHQHQLPFHLQHGAAMAPRQSPHMVPMQMHTPHQAHSPHVGYNSDDHRMMHSNSAQSFASPRMAPTQVAYPPAMNSPAQVPYSQPLVSSFVGTAGAPPMGPYRSVSNNPAYVGQQPNQMPGPMMMQPPFMSGPQGMVPAHQFPGYPMNQGAFVPGGVAVPQQSMPGTNGYGSPGRSAAPMMAHQGSQQGQPVYGMSPSMGYQQPMFVPPQPGQGKFNPPMPDPHWLLTQIAVNNPRGYGNLVGQHYGTSPQQMHQYAPQHRSGSNNYGNKNFSHGQQHQGPQTNHGMPAQNRAADGPEEAK